MSHDATLTPTQAAQTSRLWTITQTCLHGYGWEQVVRLDTGVRCIARGGSPATADHLGVLRARLYHHLDEHLSVWVGDVRHGAWAPRDLYVCFGRDPGALRHAVTGAPPPWWVGPALEKILARYAP